jgi:hypothetical protein
MDKPLIDALAERVERLERENRRLKRIGVVVLAAVAVTLAVGAKLADQPEFVEATRGFHLRDKDGTLRASLTLEHEGEPGLFLYTKDRDLPAIALSLDSDGQRRLQFRDKTGKERIFLGPLADGHVGIVLEDGAENQRIKLSVPSQGGPNIQLMDEGRRSRFALAVNPDGDTGLVISDRAQKSQINMHVPLDGKPAFEIWDNEGQRLFQAPGP